MKKVLIVASVASMIQQFNMENIKILLNKNCKVSVATNFEQPGTITKEDSDNLKNKLQTLGIECIQVDFPRGVGNLKQNFLVIKQLKGLSKNQYDLLHVHSPIGGVLVRITFNSSKTKILYTAHGFQFYKGGSLKDWLLFFPIEYILSFNTTAVLTINNEDTEIAKKYFHSEIYQIPGVGINYAEVQQLLKDKSKDNFLKDYLRLEKDTLIMISVGELNARKNQSTVIEAMSKVNNPKLHYIICGIGPDEEKLINLAKNLNLENNVHFMGYSHDISKFLISSDFSIFISRREGLGLAGLEAMAAGLPLISSYVGGIKDYTKDGCSGYIISDPTDSDLIAQAITNMVNKNEKELEKISNYNQKIASKYSKENVNRKMEEIYSKFFDN